MWKCQRAVPDSVDPDESRGITWVVVALDVHAGVRKKTEKKKEKKKKEK